MAGILAMSNGESDQAVEIFRNALVDNPLSASGHYYVGLASYGAERYVEAQVEFLKALELNSNDFSARLYLGQVLLAMGTPAEALQEFDRSTSEDERLFGHGLAYYGLGRKADADLALSEYEKKFAAEDAYGIARIHAYRKEFDLAFSWLDRAFRQHENDCGHIKAEPIFKVLRSDPRYKAFLRKMKLPAPA
jgi:tetratricopeptide (TPR) repeat protein